MVWLTLLAWGLHRKVNEDLLTEGTMANPGGQDGAGANLNQTYEFGETVSLGQDVVKIAQGEAAAAERRAVEAEGRVNTLQRVRVEDSCFKLKMFCCF